MDAEPFTAEELSDLEYGLDVWADAVTRWVAQGATAAAMRNCGLWLSVQVAPREVRIVDTASLDDSDSEVLQGADHPPADTVLVVVHPMQLRSIVESVVRVPQSVDWGSGWVAAAFIDAACAKDADLRRRLRW